MRVKPANARAHLRAPYRTMRASPAVRNAPGGCAASFGGLASSGAPYRRSSTTPPATVSVSSRAPPAARGATKRSKAAA